MGKIENNIFSKHAPSQKAIKSGDIEKIIVEKVDQIGTQDLVVIALKLKPKQTKSKIKTILEDWGKPVGDWFQGGNFNSRLLKKSIVKKVGVDANGNEMYELTKKGVQVAEELIGAIKQ